MSQLNASQGLVRSEDNQLELEENNQSLSLQKYQSKSTSTRTSNNS